MGSKHVKGPYGIDIYRERNELLVLVLVHIPRAFPPKSLGSTAPFSKRGWVAGEEQYPEEDNSASLTPPLPMQNKDSSLPVSIHNSTQSEMSAQFRRLRQDSKASSVVNESMTYATQIITAERHYYSLAKALVLPSPEQRTSVGWHPLSANWNEEIRHALDVNQDTAVPSNVDLRRATVFGAESIPNTLSPLHAKRTSNDRIKNPLSSLSSRRLGLQSDVPHDASASMESFRIPVSAASRLRCLWSMEPGDIGAVHGEYI
ncbi:hypothetical protein B0H16DRAFT_1851939 [Mycena metata]|uniref:Uncharacterized protein n=1 Tax=Mycena metata TaxID=1033252 RepID=A0AAD7N552_9AGAR|nr:hypothetical protein B0H16DRAFT_1851939 [Mycena metata]